MCFRRPDTTRGRGACSWRIILVNVSPRSSSLSLSKLVVRRARDYASAVPTGAGLCFVPEVSTSRSAGGTEAMAAAATGLRGADRTPRRARQGPVATSQSPPVGSAIPMR